MESTNSIKPLYFVTGLLAIILFIVSLSGAVRSFTGSTALIREQSASSPKQDGISRYLAPHPLLPSFSTQELRQRRLLHFEVENKSRDMMELRMFAQRLRESGDQMTPFDVLQIGGHQEILKDVAQALRDRDIEQALHYIKMELRDLEEESDELQAKLRQPATLGARHRGRS